MNSITIESGTHFTGTIGREIGPIFRRFARSGNIKNKTTEKIMILTVTRKMWSTAATLLRDRAGILYRGTIWNNGNNAADMVWKTKDRSCSPRRNVQCCILWSLCVDRSCEPWQHWSPLWQGRLNILTGWKWIYIFEEDNQLGILTWYGQTVADYKK